jgi:hypothetical protein
LCGHLSGTYIAVCLKRRSQARCTLAGSRRRRKCSGRALQPCSRWGLPVINVSADPVRSYFKSRRTAPFRPYQTSCEIWRYVSVALSGGSPRPAVSRHRCPVEPGLSSVAFLAGRAAATRMTSALSIAYFAPRVTGRLAPAEWSCLWASSRPRAWRERRRSRSRSHRRSVSEAAGHGKRIGSQAAFPASKPSAG